MLKRSSYTYASLSIRINKQKKGGAIMSRGCRPVAQSGCYHVVQRGNGQQIIYENAKDYQHFLDLLIHYRDTLNFKILAYCLMENHFHLLLQTKDSLGQIMQAITRSYSIYYNTKYERTGHVFQGRFHSEIIDDKAYFYNVIQYIHLNPEKSNICLAKAYRWSSYREYVGTPKIVDTYLLYSLISGKTGFLELMKRNIELKCLDVDIKPVISDEAAIAFIQNELGLTSGTQLLSMNRTERNIKLRALKNWGLSIRQIARLTGISKSVIARI